MVKQITIGDLLKMFLSHIKLIIIITLLGVVISFVYVSYMVTPTYTTSALIIVQNGNTFESDLGSNTAQASGEKVNMNDISSSVMLANTCSTLFTVDPTMKSIISGANVSISVIEDSYFLRITSSSSDPHTAANIANLVANTAPEVFKKYFGDGGKVDTVDVAAVPSSPSSPQKSKYILIGFLAGLVLSLAISFLIEIVDTTIKSDDDLYKQYNIPVFAEIVDLDQEGGGKKK